MPDIRYYSFFLLFLVSSLCLFFVEGRWSVRYGKFPPLRPHKIRSAVMAYVTNEFTFFYFCWLSMNYFTSNGDHMWLVLPVATGRNVSQPNDVFPGRRPTNSTINAAVCFNIRTFPRNCYFAIGLQTAQQTNWESCSLATKEKWFNIALKLSYQTPLQNLLRSNLSLCYSTLLFI